MKKHYKGITEKELYDTYKLRIEDLVKNRIERYDLYTIDPEGYWDMISKTSYKRITKKPSFLIDNGNIIIFK